jgi:hypothetical protein
LSHDLTQDFAAYVAQWAKQFGSRIHHKGFGYITKGANFLNSWFGYILLESECEVCLNVSL